MTSQGERFLCFQRRFRRICERFELKRSRLVSEAMPKRCVAAGCDGVNEKCLSLHKFPKNPETRSRWSREVAITRSDWKGPSDHSVLCSLHFTQASYHCLTRQSFASSVLDCEIYRVVAPASDHRLMKVQLIINWTAPRKANRIPSLDYARLKEAGVRCWDGRIGVCAATGVSRSYELFVVAAKAAYETHLPVKSWFVRSKPWLDTGIIVAHDLVTEVWRTTGSEKWWLKTEDPWCNCT